MPNGMIGLRAAVRDIEARKNMGRVWGDALRFRLDEGQIEVVRFLEQGEDLNWAWSHDVPVGHRLNWPVPCRDQDENGASIGERCPGCEQRLPRKFKGWINLIWRDAPVFARSPNGWMKRDLLGKPVIESTEDQVAVWNSGTRVFETLDGKDLAYEGLRSRDFRVARRGAGPDTTYAVDPADPNSGPVPLNDNDKKLEAKKVDLTPYVTPQPYDTWGMLPIAKNGVGRSDS